MWGIVVRIFGPAPYPLITHTFLQPTLDEARALYAHHLSKDTALRDCVQAGTFNGRSCRSDYFEGPLTGQQIQALTTPLGAVKL